MATKVKAAAKVRPSAKRALARYREKRDFKKTSEPSGQSGVAAGSQLRFVIQKHAASHLHYDLRLELDGVFKSWAVTRGPSVDPADKRLAVEVEDHPLDYGDFEGIIPKGEYGGGTVQLWDRGYWVPEGSKTPQEALRGGDLKFTLKGTRLHGSWVLVRIKNDRYGNKRTNWLLIKHRDAAAQPGAAQKDLDVDRSVASGRSMSQIAAGKGKPPSPFMLAAPAVKADATWKSNRTRAPADVPVATQRKIGRKTTAPKGPSIKAMPTFIEPQLCKLVDRPPSTENWAHEVKFDGYRAQLRVQSGEARIRTRKGLDWTAQFAAIAQSARRLPDCIIDGEICALDRDQIPSFAALQAALSEDKSDALVFFAFDLLIDAREDRPG
jgi:bifunctional non-homologous end joining protein LigD